VPVRAWPLRRQVSGMNSQAPIREVPAKPRAGSAGPGIRRRHALHMSPEVQGRVPAPMRGATIFAVGVMAYRMLTGRLPRAWPRPPRQSREGPRPRVDGWAAKCMEEEPEEAFPERKGGVGGFCRGGSGSPPWRKSPPATRRR
jgi:hypothetical protein